MSQSAGSGLANIASVTRRKSAICAAAGVAKTPRMAAWMQDEALIMIASLSFFADRWISVMPYSMARLASPRERGRTCIGYKTCAAGSCSWRRWQRPLPPSRRTRSLPQRKKEGSLTLYTSFAEKDLPPLTAAFEKEYGVKVKVWRAGSE